MDPDEILSDMRDTVSRAALEYRPGENDTVDALIGHFQDLDGWLSRGGFLPAGWSSLIKLRRH